MASKGYKYSSYKRTVASTEYSLGTHEAKSTYRRETGTEYSSAKGGASSSTREVVSGSDTRTLPVYIAIQDYKPETNDKDGLPLEEGQIVEVLDNKNPASWLVRTKARPPQTGWAPGSLFESPAEYYRQKRKTREITNGVMHMTKGEEALAKRDTVFHELLRTEEEYVSHLHHLINTYVKLFDDPTTPAPVRQMRDQLAMNLRELYNFHANILLKGLQYYSDDPGKVGQTFVRLERDFDHHVKYCRDLPDAEKLLEDAKMKDFFDQIKGNIEKENRKLIDYLRLPQTRLLQYQQYIKELIKYTARAELSTESLQRALELMLSIPRRATDLNYIKNLQDFPGDTGKLGRLLRHEQFRVWEGDKSGDGNLRYVFLFKSKLVFTERQDPEDPDEMPEFKHVATIRLDKYDIQEEDDMLIFVPTDPSSMTYYLQPVDKSQAEFAKQAWVKEVSEAKEGLGPDEGPPRKKPKSPPAISPSASTQSLASSSEGMTTTGTLEMQGARVTRTQYGFRTLHESSAKMCLKVSGYPLPVITWFKDGVQLHEDERHKFYADDEGFFAMTIDPVLVDDTGRYTCVATNEYGQATTSAFFRVVKVEKPPTPPKFSTKLKDIEISEGGSATFECEVEGWPEPEITFFVDGQAIHPSHDFHIEYDGQKATLKIRDVQPEDAGLYSIRLINEMGVKDCQAQLKVQEDPDKRKVAPEFQQVIEDKVVDEGDTVKFKVLCTGDPEPEVTWHVNGHLLTPGENVNIIAEDGVYILTIRNVSTHFDGEVTCRAVNRLGDISCTGRLTVRSKAYEPSFEQELVDKTVREGESVKYEVAVASEPEPVISWHINGRELKPSSNIKIGSRPATGVYTLEILKMTPDLAGEIECRAENDNGSAVSSAKLSIAGQTAAPATSSVSRAPIIKQEFSDITVNVGDTVRLTLTTEGDQEAPVVKWLLNGKDLKPGDGVKMTSKTEEGRHELVVENVTKQLAGTIECVVENETGSSSCKAKVTVTEGERPPTFKAGLPDELPVETGQSVKIQVNVDSKQAAKVTWLLNGKDVKNLPDHFRVTQDSKDTFNLEILDVTTDLSGEIECRLETVGGKASSRMKLIVSEPQPTIFIEKELPESVQIKEGESLKLEMKIRSESSVKKSTWELNGKEIKESSNVKTTSQTEKGTFSLTVQKVTSEFSGTLVCKVKNKGGEVTESKTEINVEAKKAEESKKVEEQKKAEELKKAEEKKTEEKKKEAKPVIKTEPPKEIKTAVGESVEIVVVTDSQTDAKVTWSVNGKEIKESANVKKITETTTDKQVLQISEVTSEMSGEITCKIENKLGAATAKTKLTVEKKPEPPEKKQKLMQEETKVTIEEKMETSTTTIEKRVITGVEPKLVSELQDTMVAPGEPLKLELTVSGDPPPKVTWTLNGKQVVETEEIKITSTAEGRHTLEIAKAKPDFTGTIVCIVENEVGSTEATCQVAVVRRKAQSKPEFQSKIPPVSVAEGDTLRVRVLITGDPDPRVKWYINDRIVVETEDTQLLADNGVYTLEIQGASNEMIGKLKCVAYNSRGEISQTTPITVTQKIPVEFEQYLCDTTCREGDTLKLKAVLLGEPEPQVTWYVNGRKLEESQNVKVYQEKSTYIVVIKDITLDYAGEVVCKAVNEYGEASSSAKLTIAPRGTPPDFTEWLSNIATKEGATIKHKVVFTGDPTPKITWYVNNEEVTGNNEDYSVKLEKDVCMLTIKKFKSSMVGEIICKAENDAGEVSCTAQMSLASARDEHVSEHSELEALLYSERDDAGSDAGTDIPDDMTDEESIRTQTPITAPKFITKIKDVRVKKGHQAIFECVVPDTKGVCVKWLKDGNEIELLARIRVKHRPGEGNAQLHQLVIDSVRKEDSGMYQCILTNEAGEELSAAMLEVLEEELPSEMAPEFTRSLENLTVIEGAKAVLECAVTGLPAPVVEWYKDGKKLKSNRALSIESTKDGTQRLIIRETTVQDAGTYEVVISSKVGTTKQEAQVTVTKEKAEDAGKPAFVTELRSTTVVETEEIRLECKVTGKPTPDVKWFKDDKEVKKTKNMDVQSKADGTQILTVKSSTTEDSGEYKCEATNKVGTSTTKATITVTAAAQPMEVEEPKPKEDKPKFDQPLKSQTVEEGESISLQCVVSGQPHPAVKFYKDGKEVKEDKMHKIIEETEGAWKLVIQKVTATDIGQYKAEAVNIAGKASTEASLNLKTAEPMEVEAKSEQAPEFVSSLEAQTVTVGETATLECRVQGQPQPVITWLKDGKEVKPDKRHTIEALPDGTQRLILHEAVVQDIGQYTCKATSTAGKITTEARVTVREAEQKEEKVPEEFAPEFSSGLKSCTVKSGETAVFECAVSGTPKPEVKWFKDGKEVKPDATHKIEQLPDGKQKLTISRATDKDVGEYVCEAKSSAGAVTTAAELEVKFAVQRKASLKEETAPQFSTDLENCTVQEGETAVLECAVTGKPMPEVKWMKDGQQVQPDTRHKIESLASGQQKLSIIKASEEDVGEYTCEAVNAVGSAASFAHVDVKFAEEVSIAKQELETAPEFVKELPKCTVNVGETAALECAVVGQPAPKVIWLKDGKEVKPDDRHIIESEISGSQKLMVVKATKLDAGQYTCKAISKAGEAETVGELQVKVAEQKTIKDDVAPEFTKTLQACVAKEGETVVLDCAVSGKPKPEVKWYKNDEEIHADKLHKIESTAEGKLKLIIEKVTKDDIGQYRVEAVSVAGTASTAAKLEVKVAEAAVEEVKGETAPEFKTQLAPCTVSEGQTAVLECSVTGKSPIIRWLKDGKELKPTKDILIESKPDGTQRLTIKDAKAGDIGQYAVEAATVGGKAKSEAQLNVKTAKEIPMEGAGESAPDFVGILKAAQATEGEQAVLECRVVASPAPTVKWLKDGEEVKPSGTVKIESKPDGTQRLILKDAKAADAGEYRCEAANEVGTAWTEGPLTVKVAGVSDVEPSEIAPDFVEPLRAQRATEGEEVRLECKVTGVPHPEIRWFKDGEVLKPSKHVEIEAKDDGTQILIVHAAKTDDVGEYRCEATNVAGVVWSDATLSVKTGIQSAEARGEETALHFAQALHAVKASEGETATFECQLDKATLALKPEIHWYKDGKEVKPSEHVKVESKPDGTQRLVVQDAVPEDIGEYKCEVIAKDGQAVETHAPLSVSEEKVPSEMAPTFTTPLKECQAVEGQVAQLECAVEGKPKPEIKWLKDGKPVKPSAHVKIEETVDGTQRLIIDAVHAEDVGAYRCEAVNAAGTAGTDAKLQISTAKQEEMEMGEEAAPEFIQDLKEVKANEGEEAVFECKVSGFPRPEVRWFRDGRELKPGKDVEMKSLPDGTEQLVIHKAQAEDQGNYRISATNVAGSMSSKAPLSVNTAEEMEIQPIPMQAPEFTEPLHECKANEGATALLECVVAGTPQPKIVWYKDNKPIQAGPRHVVESFIDGRQRLTVYQARSEDIGTYQCVALSVAGKAETEADVKVEEKIEEPSFSKGLKNVKVKEGETVKMACQVSMKNQKRLPEIKWYKNGGELKADKRVVIQSTPDGQCNLTIHQALAEDAGTYVCTISNAAGEAKTEATVTVEAFRQPEFTGKFDDVTVPEGAVCKLETTVSGLPFPDVKWLKDGKELRTKGRIKIQKDEDAGVIRLIIEDVQPQDEGTYRCTLTNEAGTASAKATVSVQGKMEVEEKLEAPKFVKGIQNQNATEGDDVTLTCVVAGEPFPEVFWFKGGRPLKPNGHYQIETGANGQCILRIKNTTPDDTASYTVKLINPAGEAESVADVYVEGKVTLEPPAFTRGLEDRTVSEKTTVVLEVEVNTTEVFIKWLRNGQEIKPADGKVSVEKVSEKVHRLTIYSASTSADAGEYTAVATNDVGTASTSGKLTVEKAEELIAPKFRRGLQDQTSKPGVQLTLDIEVEGKPKTVKWYKANNELHADKNIKIEKVDDAIYRLTITSVRLEDAGDYSVEATNDQGSATSEGKLTVEALKFPTIVKGLQDVQADEGAKATFEVEVSGKPKTVKWYKNGREVIPSKLIAIHKVDDSHYRLVVESVAPEDEATYRVEAGNEAGTVGSEAALTIKKRVSPKEEEPMEVEAEAEATLTIVRGLDDQKADEGKDVTLEVELSAAPALLKWYKGGKELKPGADKRILIEKVDETIYRLTVSGTLVDDTGNYKVVASNAAGTVGSEAKVAVEPVVEKPSIVKGLQDTEAPEGGKISFDIEVLGKPQQVTWYKNGKELSADKRVKIDKVDDTHYRLTVSDVNKDDEATFKVQASNDAGTDSSEAALTVKLVEKKKPAKKEPSPEAEVSLTIVKGLEDQKSDEGLDVTFEVELSDKPTSFKWTKGGAELTASKRVQIEKVNDKVYRLTVSKVQIDDGGTYKFEASNAAGTVASSAKLSVQPKVEQPKIVKGLKNADVEEGANVTFEVEVTGKPKTVKWYKNGKELTADKRVKIDKVDDSHFKLTLPDANSDDEATYRVELGNDAGTADSDASLTVRKRKPKEEKPPEPAVPMEAEATLTIVKPLEDQNADDGDNVAFDVELSDKPKTVKWYKNGEVVKPDKRYRLEDLGDNKFRLLLTDVGKDEEATYKVEASNDSGTTSSEAKLTVKGKAPKFKRGLEDKSATAGVKIILEVEVEGKPKTVKWYKNGKEMKASKRILIDKIDEMTHRLTFTTVEKDDGASYKVEASNDYGTATTEGTLKVEEPPKKAKSPEKPSFAKPLTDQAVEEGAKVTFDVEVTGKPKTVKWYKNGREIKPDKRIRIEQLDEKSYRMVIGEATKDDEATYKVEAANDAGTVDCQAKLTVHPPKPTKAPEEDEGVAAKFVLPLRSETVPEDQSVSLTCKVKGKPFPEVAWLKDNVELEASERILIVIGDDGKCELVINEAKADDAGTYTCLAQNVHGGDRTKCTLNVETKSGPAEVETGEPPEFVKPLRNKTVIEGEDLTLEVKIVGKPMPDVCWYKNGDEVAPSERITGQIDCVSDEVIFRLHIKNARLDDTHTYKCVAQNMYGTASSSGKVTVESLKPAEQAPAKFVLPLQETSVVEGKTAIFDVKVRGRPTPELTFYKDRKEITESGRVHIEDLGDNRWRLTIENVSSTDAGLYEARCTNSLGSDLCEAHLAVQPSKDRRRVGDDQYPPVFNVPLHDRRVAAGSTMTVECYVDAKPRAQIKWYKGEISVEEDDRVHIETYPDGKCRLRILQFMKEDEALFKCVATNDLGAATTYAKLTVEIVREEERITKKEYAPFFTRDLSDRKVVEGSPLTLECQVDGAPTPEIRWFKDGVPVVPTARIQIEHLDDGTCRLSISKALASDMGAYRCVASNRLGASNSVGLVAVEGPKVEKKKEGEPPTFLKGLSDLWIEKGTPFTLRCQVTGTPKPEVRWYKDGTLMRGNDRIDIAYSDDGMATLTVQDSSFADEGFYRCVAENAFGSANSIGTVRVQALREKRQITLDEGEAPKFVVPLEDWTCSEGSTVEFDCKVTGRPAPTLKWYKDGGQLLSDHRISFEQLAEGRYRLTIQGAKGVDEGTYRCVATNEAGAATSKALLKLEGPSAALPTGGPVNMPGFAVPLRDVRAVEGNPIVLECKLNGEPLPEVKWYKDGELLLPSDRIKIETYPDGTARLYIDKCHPGDEGIYRVLAESPAGTANMKANVSVKKAFIPTEAGVLEEDLAKERAPKVIVPLESEASKEGFSVTLSCRITGIPQPTIQWFKDGERLYPFGRHQMEHKPDGTVQLKIDNLAVEDTGCYRCVAENDSGTARTTCQLTVEGKMKKTPSKLADELAKGKAPGFLTPLTVKRVAEGNTVVFECLPYGNPFPVIKWLKDGMELSSSDRVSIETLNDNNQRLTIHEALMSDEGFYRCVASNEFGTSSTKAELIVEGDVVKRAEAKRLRYEPVDEGPPQDSKPRFRRGLRNVTVNQGSPAEFEVAVAGVPQPTVRWYKNGQELRSGDKVITWQDEWGFNRLVVLNAQSEDEAEYSCEATNPLGSAKSECSLHVLKDRYAAALHGEEALPAVAREGRRGETERKLQPPGFMRQIKNKHVFSGFPAIFDCIIVGNPTPDVVWYHNGKPIQPDGRIKIQKCGGGSHALVILKTTPEDEGEYVCKAANSVGTATSSAVLEVTVPLLDKMHFDGHYDFSQWLGDQFDFRRVPYAGVPTPPDRGPFIAEVTGHYLTLSWIPTRRPPPRYPQMSYIVEMRELPDKEWMVVDYNIAQPCCKVRNMELGKSYQFRVRAENIYGISEPSPPSPPSQLMAPPKPVLDKRRRPIPLLDPYAQEAMNKAYGEQYACAPWFAPRATDKTACAVHEGLEVTFFVYGFPDPDVKWYFRGWELDTKTPGTRFETKCYGGTECVLKIKDFQPEDVGQYQCIAKNLHGEAQQHIFVELASLPVFLQPLENKVIASDRVMRLDCRVDGNPYPEIKWFKDWHPIVASSRIKLIHEPPYLHTLVIHDPILRDTGIYTCTAVNEAGRVSSTATVTIQAEPAGFEHVELPPRKKPVLMKPRKLREFYEVEEEAIQKDPRFEVHRVTEKSTGRKFLAKIMPGKARRIAQNEIDLWNRLFYHPNLPYIWDAFDDGREVAIVYENMTGGGLLDKIVANERVPEARIAFFMRQLLQALEHMHKKNVVHLDLKPENIMLSENGSDQIKLTDFGLSRRLRRDKPTFGVLGAPEFVSPEVVAQKPVSLATDLWSVGVLAYVMLSGKSPFLGDSDTETLANVANVRWAFDPKLFDPVSSEAKDFISKLLVLDPKKRLDVHAALAHPWVQLADTKSEGQLLTTQFLKEFKYRHQWVERRIFVQYGNDDEDARARLFSDNLEWLEPTYFPLQPSAKPERAQIEATLPLPSAKLTQRQPLPVQLGRAGAPDSAYSQTPDKGKASGQRGKDDHKRRRGDGPGSLDEIPDFDVYVSRGERRPIEDELASRILSDIDEEGSMISEEAASKASSRLFSMESLIEDRLGEGDAAEYERNTTPTQDDYPTSTVIKLAPGKTAQMTVQIDDDVEKPPMKSPVRLSPTKEEVMECIVAAKKSEEHKAKDTGIEPKALLPLQRSAKLADHEFEQLMANAERVKEGIRQRLREGKPAAKEPPREMNGHDRHRGPARPLTDFDVPYPAYELDDYDWDSQYQMGPETFLLQLRDAGMATRVRDYRRHLYGDSASFVVNGWLGDINNDITLRERRRYTDLIKNNKDLKEAAREADRSTEAAKTGAIKRFRGIQSTLVPAPMVSSADGTHSPIFQTRLKDAVFAEDGQATFQCAVLANPPAEIVWYHNEAPIMIEAGVTRHTMTYDSNKAVLVIKPALAMDAGTYKCVAKNSLGESFSEAKLRLGDAPDRTSRPDVELASDTEVFITWEAPTPRSGSDILGYKLEFRRAEEWSCPWFVVSDNLDEEAVVVRKLEPLGIYQFKVTPRNTYGWGEASLASRIIQTHGRGAPKLNIELLKRDYHLNIVNLPQSGALGEIPEEGGSLEGSPSPSERREQAAKTSLELNTKDDPKARFQLESEIFRGRFCLIRNAVDKQSEHAAHCVAKVLMANLELRRQAMKEFEALREIQHEHVVTLLSAYLREDFLILFLEKLADNLIERFTYNDYYTEEHVARVMSQLLSALQWIHFKKICHLDLQPDNIMFTSKRGWNVKVLDTGSAVRFDIEKGEAKVERLGAPEYAAPEVLHTGLVTPAADIWGIGLISYLLLSGMHPFMTDDPRSQEEVVRNIVREKLDLNFVYTNASQEALCFMTWALKKQPGNRMNTEEGLQHRWLSFHETMIRRRENIKFSANRLRSFARSYFQIRKIVATDNNQLLTTYGSGAAEPGIKRSASFGK